LILRGLVTPDRSLLIDLNDVRTAGVDFGACAPPPSAIRGEPAPGVVVPRVSPRFPRIQRPQRLAGSAAALRRAPPIDLAQADVAASLGDGEQAIDPLDFVEILGQGLDREVVHGAAARLKKFIHQLDGLRFAPHVRSAERFRPLVLGLLQDLVQHPVRVPSVSLEQLSDSLDSVRFRPDVLVRQLARLFRKIFPKRFLRNFRRLFRKIFLTRFLENFLRKIFLTSFRENFRRLFRKIFLTSLLENFSKNCRKRCRKVFGVRLVIEPLLQEPLQRVMQARLQQAKFQATPPQDLPCQIYQISHKQLIDDINGLYRRPHPANQLVIEGGVFSLQHGRRTKEGEPLCPRGGRCHRVGFFLASTACV
jgi:hypothetical protein